MNTEVKEATKEEIVKETKVERIRFNPEDKTEYKINDAKISEMSKAEIEAEVKELETIAEKTQRDLSNTEYPITLKEDASLRELIKFVEKDLKWEHRTAGLVISLYNELRNSKISGLDDKGNIYIFGKDVAHLYNSLALKQGSGYYEARAYLKMLQNSGESISNAMKAVADSNQIIRDIHTRLSELDARLQEIAIDESGVKVEDVEEVKKKSKKIKEAEEKAGEVLNEVKEVTKE